MLCRSIFVKFPQRGLTEIKPRVLSKELDKCHHPFCKKHRNSDENTFFKNSLPPSLSPRRGPLIQAAGCNQ